MPTIRELVTRWGFKVDDRPLRRVDRRIDGIKKDMRGLATLTRNVAIGIAGLGTGIGFLLREAGDFEQIEVAFDVLIQNTEKAKALTEDLIMFAQRTPFKLKGVFDGTKQLLAYGVEAENMISTLTALGNVAAGVGREKLPQLILAFGQVRTAGKLRGQEVRQFTEAGVPVAEIIAKEFGIAKDAVQDFISAGNVSFERFNKAFLEMAGPNGTGRFVGLMDRQSKTLLGLFSNLQDAIQVLAITVGGTLVPEAKEYVKTAIDWLTVNKELIQQRLAAGLKVIVRTMEFMGKAGRALWRIIKANVEIIGGFENAVKFATIALATLLGMRVAHFFGNVAITAGHATRAMIRFAVTSRGAAAFLLGLKAVALAIPIAIGAAMAGLFLLIEDFVVFSRGGKSLIGSLVDNFDEAAPRFLKTFDKLEKSILGKINGFFEKVNRFMTAKEFAPQRERLAEGLITAVDVGLVASGKLLKLGFRIGQAIFNGVADAFIEGSPTLAAALGLVSSRQLKKDFSRKSKGQKITGAAAAIEQFGEEDARAAFGDEAVEQAKQFTESPAAKFLRTAKGKAALRQVDPTGRRGLRDALKDNIITFDEFKDIDKGALRKLREMTGIDTRQLIATSGGRPFAETGRGQPPVVNMDTKVEINGTNLSPEQLEETTKKAVRDGQMESARELQRQATGGIAE